MVIADLVEDNIASAALEESNPDDLADAHAQAHNVHNILRQADSLEVVPPSRRQAAFLEQAGLSRQRSSESFYSNSFSEYRDGIRSSWSSYVRLVVELVFCYIILVVIWV